MTWVTLSGSNANIFNFTNETYHNNLFPTAAILTGNLDVYLILLHIVRTCEYGPTNWSTHLLGPFLVGWAFSGSCRYRTPVTNSNCHDRIMINIMIVLLPRSVHVRTIVKDKRYPQMHEHMIMQWGPNIFPISLLTNTTSLASYLYHIIFHIISHNVSHIIYHIFHVLFIILTKL